MPWGVRCGRRSGAVTTVPVCYVINTHGHPDHVFGNTAFADDRPEFIGHARLAEALRRRGHNYLNALRRDLGDAADQSGVVFPTRSVASTDALDLGGRTLSLRAWPTAHTDHDLTVFDQSSQTLWLGDLLFVGHVPVVDGNLRGFLTAMGELRTLRASLVVPGHGRALAWPDAIAPQERYLRHLLGERSCGDQSATHTLRDARAGRRRARALAAVRPIPQTQRQRGLRGARVGRVDVEGVW